MPPKFSREHTSRDLVYYVDTDGCHTWVTPKLAKELAHRRRQGREVMVELIHQRVQGRYTQDYVLHQSSATGPDARKEVDYEGGHFLPTKEVPKAQLTRATRRAMLHQGVAPEDVAVSVEVVKARAEQHAAQTVGGALPPTRRERREAQSRGGPTPRKGGIGERIRRLVEERRHGDRQFSVPVPQPSLVERIRQQQASRERSAQSRPRLSERQAERLAQSMRQATVNERAARELDECQQAASHAGGLCGLKMKFSALQGPVEFEQPAISDLTRQIYQTGDRKAAQRSRAQHRLLERRKFLEEGDRRDPVDVKRRLLARLALKQVEEAEEGETEETEEEADDRGGEEAVETQPGELTLKLLAKRRGQQSMQSSHVQDLPPGIRPASQSQMQLMLQPPHVPLTERDMPAAVKAVVQQLRDSRLSSGITVRAQTSAQSSGSTQKKWELDLETVPVYPFLLERLGPHRAPQVFPLVMQALQGEVSPQVALQAVNMLVTGRLQRRAVRMLVLVRSPTPVRST